MQLGIKPNLRELNLSPIQRDYRKLFNHLDAIGWTPIETKNTKKGEWGMISLRGYSSDPRRLGKPADQCKAAAFEEEGTVFTRPNAAMSPSLVKEKVYDGYEFTQHYLNETGELQDCSIRYGDVFKVIEEVLEPLPCKFQRIRFAKLTAGGFLEPHTDSIDESFGIQNGAIARIAIPLQTNEKCTFSVWPSGPEGVERKLHLKEGHYYYTDVFGWHSIKNDSQVDRIHLLVDCYSNRELRRLILG